MTAFLHDIPLGRTEVGLTLHHAWFLNGCLFNSEVWSDYTNSKIKELYHKIMRLIVGAQSKVPTEMFYLETSETQIKDAISVRRLKYLQTILKRHKDEITNRIYSAMKYQSFKDDWIELVMLDKSTSKPQEYLKSHLFTNQMKSTLHYCDRGAPP